MRRAVRTLALAAAAGACRQGRAPVAELVEAQNRVEGSRAETPGAWRRAAPGSWYFHGDAVRTGGDSAARLRLGRRGRGARGALKLGPDTVVRFGARLDEVDVDMGDVEVEAAAPLVVRTRDGVARVGGGARTRTSVGRDRVRFDVLVGAATVETGQGRSVALGAGQKLEVRIGGAIVEETAGPAPAPPAPAPLVEPPAPTPPEDAAAPQPGPSVADVTVRAGGSAVVHDPAPPTAVRIRFDGICPGVGVIEVGRRASPRPRAAGEGGAILALARGAHRYRVRCEGSSAVATAGSLRILRDAAVARLPGRPPRTELDADGRRYTVLYQSVPPEMTFRWRRAPSAGPFTLHLAPVAGRPRTVQTPAPSHVAPSGEIGDGSYEWWFERAGGGGRSPRTTLRIDFDNAAQTVSIREPAPDAGWTGDRVRVSGVALEGWQVSVHGEALALDRGSRFAAEVPAPPGGALAIRLYHPRHGQHYYVRRDASRR